MIGITRKISTITLSILAIVALGTVNFVSKANKLNQWYRFKIKAANIMWQAEKAIKEESLARGIPINIADDPNSTGLIGEKNSSVTTDKGFLDMKLMATNPNLAAVIVDMFKEAGLKSANLVAVGYTGSFPGANIAVLSAIESLGLDAIIISSVGSSNWGTNNPDFTWLDMENVLFKRGIVKHRSIAASLGGKSDRAIGLSPESKGLLEEAIKRNKLIYINENNLEAGIYKRLELYDRFARDKAKRIKVYVNVGGGHASLGSGIDYMLVPNGVSKKLSIGKRRGNGIIFKMAERGIPIIHILKLRELTYKYGLPAIPSYPPLIGEGKVFQEERYSNSVALMGFVFLIFVILIGLIIDSTLLPKAK